jgi:hypothetical protein
MMNGCTVARVGDWVMVFGERIGEINFVGQVIGLVDADRDHDYYEVADYERGVYVICCCHLIEKVQTPSRSPIMRHSPYMVA